MNQLRSLLWKEWFEVRVFLGTALFVFLGLPMIGAVEELLAYRRFEIGADLWVFLLGGAMAVVVGVGVVARDLNGRLDDFWRSRPVSAVQWLVTKYFVGLAVVLVSLAAPLMVEIAINRRNATVAVDPRLVLAWHPYLWIAAFSIAFGISCLIRRAAHAGMLSIAGLLLLYFLPPILPPIRFLAMHWAIDFHSADPSYSFVMGMIAIGLVGLTVGLLAVHRDWRLEAGRRMIYWSIGGALLLLFATSAFQVATNLPLLARGAWPEGDCYPSQIHWDESSGVVIRRRFPNVAGSLIGRFHLANDRIEVEPAFPLKVNLGLGDVVVWSPQRPDVFYVAGFGDQLTTVRLLDHEAEISTQAPPDIRRSNPCEFAFGDRLFMFDEMMLTFDISDPLHPRQLSAGEAWTPQGRELRKRFREIEWSVPAAEMFTLPLPQAPDLLPRQRLEMLIAAQLRTMRLSGDLLVSLLGERIVTYTIEKLTDEIATFRRLGQYQATPIDRLLGTVGFAGEGSGPQFIAYSPDSLSPLITVFDLTGINPRPIGHYATPHNGLVVVQPMPDGRILAAGITGLELLGPPPRRD